MKIAVVGATGLVGTKIIEVLEERDLSVDELIPVASERSIGKKVNFNNKEWEVVDYQTAIDKKPDCAIFSAGWNYFIGIGSKICCCRHKSCR